MKYHIPLFDLNFDKEEENAVINTLRSKWISCGPKTEEFEIIFAEMLNVNYALALSNCTASLHLASIILNIAQGDEVIVPSLTFVATVNSIRYTGATPVFCDISSYEDLTIDPEQIKALINKNTKAIVVMHYGGFPCSMEEILKIAKSNNLFVIEDSAHAPLSEYKNKKLGTIGDVGCFSFFSNKNISTGEGGILVTNNAEYYKKAKLLRSHGMTSLSYERSKGSSTSYDVIDLGYNYRIDDIRASIGIVQLSKLKNDIEKRQKIRNMYIERLYKNESLIIPFKNNKEYSSNYIFPIVLKNSDFERRNKIRDMLHQKGIQTSVHYPAVHRFSIYKDDGIKLPITEYVSDNLITLPMYSKLDEEKIDYICYELNNI